MILVDRDIRKRMLSGDIKIDPFDDAQLNPNSYNVRLYNTLKTYDVPKVFDPNSIGGILPDMMPGIIDTAEEHNLVDLEIPEDGLVLLPNTLYLGRTVEHTETHGELVPMLEGRSSFGRVGLTPHIAAGFGDSGFCGTWTLEISVVQPVKIYRDMQIAQLFWMQASSHPDAPYTSGKYQSQVDVTPSRLYMEMKTEGNDQ